MKKALRLALIVCGDLYIIGGVACMFLKPEKFNPTIVGFSFLLMGILTVSFSNELKGKG